MSKVRILLWCVLSLSVSLPALQAQEASFPPHEKKLLFSLSFGKKWQNVNAGWPKKTDKEWFDPLGPVGLIVHSERIYIGDRLNGCVKWFSMQGKFLGKTPTSRDYLLDFAVSKDGSIFTLEHTDGRSWHKFDAEGKKLWSVEFNDVFAPNWGLSVGRLYPLADGNLGLSVFSKNFSDPRVVVFDAKGRWLYSVAAQGGEENGIFFTQTTPGKTYWEQQRTLLLKLFRINPDSPTVREAITQSEQPHSRFTPAPRVPPEETMPISSVTLKPPPQMTKWLDMSVDGKVNRENGGGFDTFSTEIQANGGFLTALRVWRKTPSFVEKSTGSKGLDVVYLAFDSQGKPLRYIRYDLPPLFSFNKTASVDARGDVYAMLMTLKGFDVVRYRPQKPLPSKTP